MNRYVIEIGMGVDLHGQDVNIAAERAIYDAVSHSCLSGLEEILHLDNVKEQVRINVTIAASRPEDVDTEALKKQVAIGTPTIKAVKGGLKHSGLYAPQFGDKDDSIEIVIAALEVTILK